MELLTEEIRKQIPELNAQENEENPIAYVKFFTPDSNWAWYATEFDGENTFFGLVVGFNTELGYFSLRELEEATGPLGLHIERDTNFKPCVLSECQRG